MAATRRPPKKLGKKHLGRSVSSSSLKAPPTPANGSPARPKTKEQQGVGAAPALLHQPHHFRLVRLGPDGRPATAAECASVAFLFSLGGRKGADLRAAPCAYAPAPAAPVPAGRGPSALPPSRPPSPPPRSDTPLPAGGPRISASPSKAATAGGPCGQCGVAGED
jgi:hypothetical protein